MCVFFRCKEPRAFICDLLPGRRRLPPRLPPSDANAYVCTSYLEMERAKTTRSTPGQRRGRRKRLELTRISPKVKHRTHAYLLHPVASSSEGGNKTDLRLPRGYGRNVFDGVVQYYRDVQRDDKVFQMSVSLFLFLSLFFSLFLLLGCRVRTTKLPN